MSPSPFSSLSSSPIPFTFQVLETHLSIPLGIIIGLIASFVQSLGLTFQRKSHVLNQQLPEAEQRVEHRRPLWLLGFAIFISSNVLGSLVQIASLPVVILAPLGAVSLLWNAFFARVLLGDMFSPWMILGTLLIAGGAVLVAVFGIVPEQTRSLEDLLALFRRPTFIAYFSLLGAVVFFCLLITHVVEYSFLRKAKENAFVTVSSASPASLTLALPENPTTLTTGVTELATTECTPLLANDGKAISRSPHSLFQVSEDNLRRVNHTRLLLAISYASFSGIISGMCLLFAKSGVELLVLTLRGHNQFWRWQAWVLVFGLVAFALLQLWYLHKALILANPTLVCPSAFCFYNISSIVNGLVYFDQFGLIPPMHLVLVVLGMFILLGGVWVVSIQSGDGVLDAEEWSDEGSMDGDIESLRDEPIKVRPVSAEASIVRKLTDNEEENEEIIFPADMGRMAISDPNIYGISSSAENMTPLQGIGLGRPPVRAQASLAQDAASGSLTGRSHRAPLLGQRHVSASDALASSPSMRVRHRRRPTIDTCGAAGTVSLYNGHGDHARDRRRTLPFGLLSHDHGRNNAVTTLGGGFQIGLSPLSPGFSIAPRDRHARGRRSSGLGFPVGGESGDVIGGPAHNASVKRGEHRRRTVSEGEVRWALGEDGQEDSVGTVDDMERGDVDASASATRVGGAVDKGKGKADADGGRPAKARWRWLKNVLTGRND